MSRVTRVGKVSPIVKLLTFGFFKSHIFHGKRNVLILTKLCWASFWAIFQTQLLSHVGVENLPDKMNCLKIFQYIFVCCG
jgi:hypothetical protein